MKISDLAAGGGFAGATVVPVVHQLPAATEIPFYAEEWALGWTGSEWSFAFLLGMGILGGIVKLFELRNVLDQKEINRRTLEDLPSSTETRG